ncbi:helix-turn-helix domain-containing protein [Sedimentibacter sp. B4]|uniref:helix-turn-helix domain-containing protein n=1 Tax=Sedimentibacter sp. B4 TaxID=304766 RepID=UPI0002EFDE1F|nr:helix-turn-helix domain-containing protein [Sedimentibacter sp. B4]
MSRRKQSTISLSNKVLKGWERSGVISKFKELGEKGLAIYFLLARRQNGEGLTWIAIREILDALNLQGRDKKEIVRVLNLLKEEGLILCNDIEDNVSTSKELKFLIETDLKDDSFTTFYPNNFAFYKLLGAKGFALFCMIESYIGTNKSGYPTIKTLEEKTGFSKNTILQYIFILNELGIFDVSYGTYDKGIRKNDNNVYYPNKVGRIKLLERINENYEEVVSELEDIKFKYEEHKSQRAEKIENSKNNKDEHSIIQIGFSIPKSESQNKYDIGNWF